MRKGPTEGKKSGNWKVMPLKKASLQLSSPAKWRAKPITNGTSNRRGGEHEGLGGSSLLGCLFAFAVGSWLPFDRRSVARSCQQRSVRTRWHSPPPPFGPSSLNFRNSNGFDYSCRLRCRTALVPKISGSRLVWLLLFLCDTQTAPRSTETTKIIDSDDAHKWYFDIRNVPQFI